MRQNWNILESLKWSIFLWSILLHLPVFLYPDGCVSMIHEVVIQVSLHELKAYQAEAVVIATARGTQVKARMIAGTEECLMRGRGHCTIIAQWLRFYVTEKGKRHLGWCSSNSQMSKNHWWFVWLANQICLSSHLLTVLSEISQDLDTGGLMCKILLDGQ